MGQREAKRILVVDDEPYMVLLMRGRLERLGYEVDEAFSAGEAYERARKTPYDLLLLDFFLPDERGDEVCRSLRRQLAYAKTPIIIITGFSSRDAEDFRANGATAVLFKPVTQEMLLEAIQKYLL